MLEQEERIVKDYLLGRTQVDWDKQAYLLNPALVQETAMKLLIQHPEQKERILDKLSSLNRIRASAPPVTVTLPACPVSRDTAAIVGCGTQEVKFKVDEASIKAVSGKASSKAPSEASSKAPGEASSKATAQPRLLFEGASFCKPKHRVAPRTAADVHTAEWVVVGIVCALVLAIIIMLVFFYRPEPRR
jgi:hypothetical protein